MLLHCCSSWSVQTSVLRVAKRNKTAMQPGTTVCGCIHTVSMRNMCDSGPMPSRTIGSLTSWASCGLHLIHCNARSRARSTDRGDSCWHAGWGGATLRVSDASISDGRGPDVRSDEDDEARGQSLGWGHPSVCATARVFRCHGTQCLFNIIENIITKDSNELIDWFE